MVAAATAAKTAGKLIVKKKAASAATKSGSGRTLAIVGGVLASVTMLVILAPVAMFVSMLAAVSGGAAAASQCTAMTAGSPGGPPSSVALADIPPVALDAYQQAANATGVDWSYLAAIGKIETNHGRYDGSKPDQNGDVSPKIRNSIDASGPMQFMPATWSSYKTDGNFDGKKSIDNLYDAALAAAHKLQADGAPGNWKKAIFAYNHSDQYVEAVTAQAATYSSSGGQPGVPSAALDTAFRPDLKSDTDSTSKWVRPVRGGSLTARFGQKGGRWSSGVHTGLDFGVGDGTPVFAAQSGFISVSHPPWAGNLITIDHGTIKGRKVQTRYAHLQSVVARGFVQAGKLIAYSGHRGNVSGPHLHFEVLVDGSFANPETFLANAGTPIFIGGAAGGEGAQCGDMYTSADQGNSGWGGYENGKIPKSAMCQVKVNGGWLRCDAAHSLNDLADRYKKKFKEDLPVKSTYRSFEDQAACKASDEDCDTPGTSRYGFGLVVKFGKPMSDSSSSEHEWMTIYGVDNGWVETGGAWEFGRVDSSDDG